MRRPRGAVLYSSRVERGDHHDGDRVPPRPAHRAGRVTSMLRRRLGRTDAREGGTTSGRGAASETRAPRGRRRPPAHDLDARLGVERIAAGRCARCPWSSATGTRMVTSSTARRTGRLASRASPTRTGAGVGRCRRGAWPARPSRRARRPVWTSSLCRLPVRRRRPWWSGRVLVVSIGHDTATSTASARTGGGR